MKAQELRIGNWVLGNKPFQIEGSDIALASTREKSIGTILWQPIPLTEEWLERFGFDEIEMSTPIAYKTKNGFRIKEDERGYWMQYKHGMTIIKHVHSLQNLYFALTGEELQIKEQ
jgi:hypothetical protein